MWTALRQRFGTLRWKLARSYVLVTLLVVLTLELVALLLVAPALGPLSTWAAGVLSLQIATNPDIRDSFEAGTPDPQRVGLLLRQYDSRNGVQVVVGADGTSQVRTSANPPAPGPNFGAPQPNLLVALVDTTGQIVTGTQQLARAQGMAFSNLESSAAQTVVDAALRGNRSTVSDASGTHAASPIYGTHGQVRGAAYVRLPLVAFGNIASGVATLLGVSAAGILVGSGFIGLIFGLVAGRGFSRRLKRLTVASAAMASGDLAQRVGDRSPDEIGQLARQFNAMAAQLDEHMRALRLLADQNAQLAEQATQLATVEERNRLARPARQRQPRIVQLNHAGGGGAALGGNQTRSSCQPVGRDPSHGAASLARNQEFNLCPAPGPT